MNANTREHRDRDKFQIAAFKAFYKAAIIGGKILEEAFASAIVKSSDDETERLLKKNPNIIKVWKRKNYETEKANNQEFQGDHVI